MHTLKTKQVTAGTAETRLKQELLTKLQDYQRTEIKVTARCRLSALLFYFQSWLIKPSPCHSIWCCNPASRPVWDSHLHTPFIPYKSRSFPSFQQIQPEIQTLQFGGVQGLSALKNYSRALTSGCEWKQRPGRASPSRCLRASLCPSEGSKTRNTH